MKDLLRRLYSGENDVDFLGTRRVVGIATLVLVVVFGASLLFRGLNLGIEFEGGIVWEVPVGDGVTTDDVEALLGDLGVTDDRVQTVSSLSGDLFRIRGTTEDLERQAEVSQALAELNGVEVGDISREVVGPSWGDEITSAALTALLWFLGLIALYVTIRFEWRMAVAALVAVVHDVGISVGIYSVFGFEVTPATVIAFLTILGYSLYDTIVVFDKVRDNAALLSVRGDETYPDMVNRSLNQVIMRSINTSITSLLPVMSMLFVGAFLLGATALSEFALALLVGMLAGTYSSIFIAAPILVWLHELRPVEVTNVERRSDEVGVKTTSHPMASGNAPRPRRKGTRSKRS